MPRGSKSKTKRRKLRHRPLYTAINSGNPAAVLEHCSSMTFTPDGDDSNSEKDLAMEDYLDNMITQSDGARACLSSIDGLLVSDAEVVTRLARLSVCRSQDSSGACSSARSVPAQSRKTQRHRSSMQGKRKRTNNSSCGEGGRKRMRRASMGDQACDCISYYVPAAHPPTVSMDSESLPSLVSREDNLTSSDPSSRAESTCASGGGDGQESSLSESEGENNCDADDELSCVETPATGHAPIVAWWEDRTLSPSPPPPPPPPNTLYVSKGEDTPTNSEQELTNIVESALDNMQEPGRRGFQRRLSLAQQRTGCARGSGLVRGSTSQPPSPIVSSCGQLNQVISKFVSFDSRKRMQLPVLQPYLRDMLAKLVAAYQLKCHSKGSVTVIAKTKNTEIPHSSVISEILRSAKGNSSSTCVDSTGASMSADSPCRLHPPGPPIGDNNLGRQMLRGMGWKPGTGLGQGNRGIVEPVSAYRQPGRQGLG